MKVHHSITAERVQEAVERAAGQSGEKARDMRCKR